MPRQTRKFTQRGGDFLGEGAHGKVYNTGCIAGESLCTMLSESKSAVEKITIYTENRQVVLSTEETEEFKKFLETVKDSIVKVFKPARTIEAKLTEEIRLNRIIADKYGKDASFFTTIAPLLFETERKSYKMFGAKIELKTKTYYVVFGAKCTSKFTLDMKRFLIDIAASLVVLHGKHYTHNDIKLDNIVKCGDIYKLIDWGAATPMEFKKINHGSLLTTSPMRWYLLGYNPILSTNIIGTKTYFVRRHIYDSPHFQDTVKRINEEFYEIMSRGHTKEELFDMYKDTMDIFMLGITALHLVIENKLNWSAYKSTIEELVSFVRPLDAKKALRLVSRL